MKTTKKETQVIEFKQSWRDEYLDWICGYANAGVFAFGILGRGVVNGDVAIVGNCR
jgi:ATP-dependent DNA helicase RecG